MGIKEVSKRVIDLSNTMFKKFLDHNPEALREFLPAVGFTMLTLNRFQFIKPAEGAEEESRYLGNIEVLDHVLKVLTEEEKKQQ